MIKANIEVVDNGFIIHIYEESGKSQKQFVAKEYFEITDILKKSLKKGGKGERLDT